MAYEQGNIINMEYDTKNDRINNLIKTVERVYLTNDLSLFGQIYTRCFEICQGSRGRDLYNNLIKMLQNIVNNIHKSLLELSNSPTLLSKLVSEYKSYKNKSINIADGFLYLDKQRSRMGENQILMVLDLCITIFLETIVLNSSLRTKIIQNFLISFNKKSYEQEEIEILKEVISIYIEVENKGLAKILSVELIPIMLKDTKTYYSNLNEKYNIQNIEEYFKQVRTDLDKELFILTDIDDSLKFPIIDLVLENLVLNKMDEIINTGFKDLIMQEKITELNYIYQIITYREHIKLIFYTKFNDLMVVLLKENEQHNKTMSIKSHFTNNNCFEHLFQEIYYFKKKMNNIQINAFNKDPKIELIIKSNFEKLINNNKEDLVNQFLKHTHELIKSTIKLKNDKITDFLDEFTILYKLISDKDMFELEYRNLLSKRLLRNPNYIEKTEMPFYKIIKRESGDIFVKKIETMLNDIFVSHSINFDFYNEIQSKKKFEELNFSSKSGSNHSKSSHNSTNINNNLSNANNNNNINNNNNNNNNNVKKSSKSFSTICKDVQVYVKILSHGCWPIEKLIDKQMPNIPTLLDNHMSEFTEYYDLKFKNRTLKWIHELSWAEIKAQYKDATYSFIVSSIQMSILDIFNRFDQITVSEIIKELGMTMSNFHLIKYEVAHLVTSGILLNERTKKNFKNDHNDLGIDDILSVNTKFYHSSNKIILQSKNLAELKVKRSMSEEISHFVIEDRKYQLDSIIMKILKQNKKLEFELLKQLIFKGVQSYFVPDVNMIKNRIENLIDRVLIVEESKNPSIYCYA